MTEFQREIIEELILKPRTAQQLAWDLELDREDVVDALEELTLAGQVGTKFEVAPGDAVCSDCGIGYRDSDPDDKCRGFQCGGYLVDVCLYVYCGGPISKALEVAA